MKGNIRVISFCLLALYLVGCAPSTPDPLLPATSTITPSPVPSSTVTHTPEPTVAPTETLVPKLELPDWVSDPGIPILMTMTGKDNQILVTLTNAVSGKIHYFNEFTDIIAIFWMPDGRHIGYITLDSPNIYLINLENGEIDNYPPPNDEPYVAYFPDLVYEPLLLTAYGSLSIDEDLIFFSKARPGSHYMGPSASNGEHHAFTPDESSASKTFYIEDLASNQVVEIEFPIDENDLSSIDLRFSFSPTQALLAVLESNTRQLGLYDPGSGNLIELFRGVTTFTWSPDGEHITYDPQGYEWMWQGSTTRYDYSSVPCILNLINGDKRCPLEIREKISGAIDTFHWFQDGSKLGYSGSGEICYYELVTMKVECPTSSIPELDEKNMCIVAFNWSPDGQFIAFNYSDTCWYTDNRRQTMGGIVRTNGSEYILIGEVFNFHNPGLWRPNISP